MWTRQKQCVATDTWRSLGCRTTPLEHWSKRKLTVETRWAKQQTKKSDFLEDIIHYSSVNYFKGTWAVSKESFWYSGTFLNELMASNLKCISAPFILTDFDFVCPTDLQSFMVLTFDLGTGSSNDFVGPSSLTINISSLNESNRFFPVSWQLR